ncbi:hypothetical protein BDN72DRAFT_965327 [Pluteus cervinus]|uniref:Uncharacterized protein n=1 Tax=Pluteus cervinus TaxID=181527 RepID=A0ACD3A646_9AGAR|nr:hypothetical protein BDN72DRAFT_965327 [Pluteus cervinus]
MAFQNPKNSCLLISPSPRVPREIENVIFEIALENCIQDATSLFLVAKRVQSWLLPKVFSVVILSEQRYFPTKFTLEKFQKYGRHVRHLCICEDQLSRDTIDVDSTNVMTESIINICLSLCPNIVSFAAWDKATRLSIDFDVITGCSSLQRLSFNPLPLLGITATHGGPRIVVVSKVTPQRQQNPSNSDIFPNITHLDIHHGRYPALIDPPDHEHLAVHFPRLTHLAFYHDFGTKAKSLLSLLDRTLFPHLRVLLLWKFSDTMGLCKKSDVGHRWRKLPLEIPKDEERIVVMYHGRKDWELGARGKGMDMWSFADQVVSERRRSN